MEYIQIPEWIQLEKCNMGRLVCEFISKSKIDERRMDMNHLRNLYKEDKYKYVKIVDEMALRGFQFVSEKPNNILPRIFASSNSPRIKVIEGRNRFRKIDFDKLGIASFVRRFAVEEDVFFDDIPLEGFQYLNNSIGLTHLAAEFISHGFEVINIDHITACPGEELPLQKAPSEETNAQIDDYLLVSIDEIGLSTRPKNALRRHGISTVGDLIKVDMEFLNQIRSLGAKSIDEVVRKMNELGSLNTDYGSENIDKNESGSSFENRDLENLDSLDFSVRARNALKSYAITKVSELIEATENELFDISNIGIKTINEIIAKSSERKRELVERGLFSPKIVIPEEVIDLYGEIPISKLESNISDDAKLLKDLPELGFEYLMTHVTVEKAILLVSKVKNMMTFEEIIQDIEISPRIQNVLYSRYIEGNTLEEVGKAIGTTRERARQIQHKGERLVSASLKAKGLFQYLQLILNGSPTCSKERLLHSISHNELIYSILQKSPTSSIKYVDWIEHFFFENLSYISFSAKVHHIVEKQGNEFYMVDIIEDFVNVCNEFGIEEIEVENIQKYLEQNHCFIYGELVSKQQYSSAQVVTHLLEHHIEGGIRIDENSYDQLKKLGAKYLNYTKFPSSYRTIQNSLRECEDVLLLDKLTFIHISKITYDENLIKAIDNFLEEVFQDKKRVVAMHELLDIFKSEIAGTDLENHRILYSLLKRYLGESYVFGNKNTMNIYHNEKEKKRSLKEELIKYIKARGGVVNKSDVMADMNWSISKVNNVITNYSEFISLGNQDVRHLENIHMTNNDKEKLMMYLQGKFYGEYFSVEALYDDMKFDRSMSSFMENNFIENGLVLSQIIKRIVPDFVGHSIILFKRTSPWRTIEDVISATFTHVLKDNVKSFLVGLHLNDFHVRKILNGLVDKGLYVELSDDEILRSDLFIVEENVMMAVKKFAEDYMENLGFVALKNIAGYKKILPPFKYRWNPLLIRTILLMMDYKGIKMKHRDPRTDQLVIVRSSSDINTFEELTVSLLKEKYDGNMHESRVYDFLVAQGVLYDKKASGYQELPFELKNGKQIHVDEVGKVIMRG